MLNYQRVHGPEIDNENTGHQQYEYVMGEILGCNGNMSLAALGYIWIRWIFSPTVWGFFTHDRTDFFFGGTYPATWPFAGNSDQDLRGRPRQDTVLFGLKNNLLLGGMSF